MLIKEILFFTLPLLISGFVHHFLVIRYGLWAFLAKPVDFNLKLGGKRLFGDSKTFRGFIVVILITGISMWAINLFFRIPLKYNPFLSGMLVGLGYSLGELPNSFLKRRLGVRETSPAAGILRPLLRILDQVDSVIGSLLFLPVIYHPYLFLVLALFLAGTTLHVLVDISLYLFGYKTGLIKKSSTPENKLRR
jgi:hypothetical protein